MSESGIDIENGLDVAIKMENSNGFHKLLDEEYQHYNSLAGGTGIPRVHTFTYECDYRVMILELLGPSLEDLRVYCGGRFTLKTGLMLADQLLCRLRYIHSKYIIHGDVKPSNILMGSGKLGNVVYLTDFGSANEFDDSNTSNFLPFLGTTVFSRHNDRSNPSQYWLECPRPLLFFSLIDYLLATPYQIDLEALGFVLVYLIRGTLPWWGIRHADSDKVLDLVATKQKETTVEELCEGLPREFCQYFNHVRSVRIGQKPKYSYLRKLFRRAFDREGYTSDFVFDWTILKYLASKASG